MSSQATFTIFLLLGAVPSDYIVHRSSRGFNVGQRPVRAPNRSRGGRNPSWEALELRHHPQFTFFTACTSHGLLAPQEEAEQWSANTIDWPLSTRLVKVDSKVHMKHRRRLFHVDGGTTSFAWNLICRAASTIQCCSTMGDYSHSDDYLFHAPRFANTKGT